MAKTKADTKKTASTEKKAKKALSRAEEAVQVALDAVRDSSKALRKQAVALSEKTEKLAAKHAKAVLQLEKAHKKAAASATTAESGVDSSLLTPPLPSPQPVPPTLIQLRQRAKEQGITGYSRLNKAALIEALDSSHTS